MANMEFRHTAFLLRKSRILGSMIGWDSANLVLARRHCLRPALDVGGRQATPAAQPTRMVAMTTIPQRGVASVRHQHICRR